MVGVTRWSPHLPIPDGGCFLRADTYVARHRLFGPDRRLTTRARIIQVSRQRVRTRSERRQTERLCGAMRSCASAAHRKDTVCIIRTPCFPSAATSASNRADGDGVTVWRGGAICRLAGQTVTEDAAEVAPDGTITPISVSLQLAEPAAFHSGSSEPVLCFPQQYKSAAADLYLHTRDTALPRRNARDVRRPRNNRLFQTRHKQQDDIYYKCHLTFMI